MILWQQLQDILTYLVDVPLTKRLVADGFSFQFNSTFIMCLRLRKKYCKYDEAQNLLNVLFSTSLSFNLTGRSWARLFGLKGGL